MKKNIIIQKLKHNISSIFAIIKHNKMIVRALKWRYYNIKRDQSILNGDN